MNVFFAILEFSLAAWAASAVQEGPRLVLSASASEPYVGQQVELRLEIDVPAGVSEEWKRATDAGGLPELTIPWLLSEFGFSWLLPPEQWLCENTALSDGVPIRISPWPESVAPQVEDTKTGIHRIRLIWKLSAGQLDSIQEGVIRFEPVELKYGPLVGRSNSLNLRVRELPLPPAGVQGINLGVGQYRLETTLDRSEIDLGEEVVLTLRVIGAGELAALSWPMLGKLPGFQSFLIENGTENWSDDGASREFRYVLRPRQAGTVSLPAISYYSFDSTSGQYATYRTEPRSLTVVLAGAEEVLVTRPPFKEKDRWDSSHWFFLIVVLFLGLALFLRMSRSLSRDYYNFRRKKWELAAERALAHLERLCKLQETDCVDEATYAMSKCLDRRFWLWSLRPSKETVKWWLDSESRLAHARYRHAKLVDLIRYGPPSSVDFRHQVLDASKEVIKELKALPWTY